MVSLGATDEAAKVVRKTGKAVDESDLVQRTAEGFTPRGIVQGAVQPTTSATTKIAKAGAAGAVGFGGLNAAGDYFEAQGAQATQRTAENIRNDPDLSAEQKARLLGKTLDEEDNDDDSGGGLLSRLLGLAGGGDGGGGILGFDVKTILAILIVGFIGLRLASNTNLNLGSGSSTGSGGGG